MVEFKFRLTETELEDGGADLAVDVDPIDESKCSDVEAMIGMCLTNTLFKKIDEIKKSFEEGDGKDILEEIRNLTPELKDI